MKPYEKALWDECVALEKLVAAQDKMLAIYRTQAFHRGASVADALIKARERVEKARAKTKRLAAQAGEGER